MAADVIDEYKTDMFQIARETLPQPTLLLLQSQKHAALSCSAILSQGPYSKHLWEKHTSFYSLGLQLNLYLSTPLDYYTHNAII